MTRKVSDPTLTAISTTLKDISKCGEEKKDLDDMKKLTINKTALPKDVKKTSKVRKK